MKHHITICTSSDWSSGGTTGDGIPLGLVRANYFRVTTAFRDSHKYRYGELDGKLYPLGLDDEARRTEGLLHGYLELYYSKGAWTRLEWEQWYAMKSFRKEACRHALKQEWRDMIHWSYRRQEKYDQFCSLQKAQGPTDP